MPKTLSGSRLAKLVVVAVLIFMVGVISVSMVVNQRKESNIRRVRDNLTNVTVAASSYFVQNRTYTKSAMFIPSRSCTGIMFTDVVSGLVGLTGSPDAWPKGVTISCQADTNRYAVSASLPKSINGDGFWCVDSLGYNGPTRAHQAQGDVTC